MNLKNTPPIFVPGQFRAEIEKLSKAALMDLVWDYATTSASDPSDSESIMSDLRTRRDIIIEHRKGAKSGLQIIRDNSDAPHDGDDYSDRAEWKARI